DRLVEAQRPIRILDAIKWDDSIERAFFAAGARELPPVTVDYYAARPLPFDADTKIGEFQSLEGDIRQQLGKDDGPAQIMLRMCREFREVVAMLKARGTPDFAAISRRLYGSAADTFHGGEPTLAGFGRMMSDVLANLAQDSLFSRPEIRVGAAEAVDI